MTSDPTFALAAAVALNAFTDYLYDCPWPSSSDPLAVRDFLSGVAGYSNSLAGLPIQAEMEDRLAAMTAERDAFLDYHVMDWDVLGYAVRTPYIEGGYPGGERDTLEFVYVFKNIEDARQCARIAAFKAAGLAPSAGAATTEPEKGDE